MVTHHGVRVGPISIAHATTNLPLTSTRVRHSTISSSLLSPIRPHRHPAFPPTPIQTPLQHFPSIHARAHTLSNPSFRQYIAFLNKYSGTHPSTLRAVGAVLGGPPKEVPLAAIAASRTKLGLPQLDPAVLSTTGSLQALVFPKDPTNLLAALSKFWIAGFRRALPIYFPVFMLWKSLFNPRSLLSPASLARNAVDIARASTFLTTYTTLGWTNGILLSRTGLSIPGFNDVFFAFVCGACGCGTAVVIERKSRRMELAMYVSGRWWIDGESGWWWWWWWWWWLQLLCRA